MDIEITNSQAHLRLHPDTLAELARHVLEGEGVASASISIALVDDAKIREINARHLDHDWPTDVITFPLSAPGDEILEAELILSAEMAASTAREAGSDPMAELVLYLVHGLLHLCGYDDRDEEQARRMRTRESAVLAREGWVNTFPDVGPIAAGVEGRGEFAVAGLSLGIELFGALLAMGVHLLAVALTRALRAYSRSRLEEICEQNGRPERAVAIAHDDEKAERAAEALAVVSGLALAALLGANLRDDRPATAAGVTLLIALVVGGAGYVAAGVFGRVYAEAVLDALWPAAVLIRRFMWPLTSIARVIEATAYHRARRGTSSRRPQSVEVELHTATDLPESDVEADLPESTRSMIERVVELGHRDVESIMTPRSSMVVLPASSSPLVAAHLFTTSGKSRVPLFGEHRDDIVGILYAKDLFPHLIANPDPTTISLRKIGRTPMFVPETKNASELLEDFRLNRVQMAIALDEYGGVAGLITLEDLLEEVVGPIDDEHDVPTPTDPVVSLGDSRYEVDASVTIEDLNERLHLHLPTDEDFQTIGGLAFDALGRLPDPGATFRRDGMEFTVLEVVDHSIRRLKIDLQPAAPVEG